MQKFFLSIILNVCPLFLFCQEPSSAFKVVVLGSGGGPEESNLSGYLLAPKTSDQFIALDAGTLLSGVYIAYENGCFEDIPLKAESDWAPPYEIFRDHIKVYLISHAHLDHVAGLVINSPEDTSKPIFAMDSVIDFLRDDLFNRKIWPNFGSEGVVPILGQYQYHRVQIAKQVSLGETGMQMEAFLLSHPGCYESTAFLIESSGSYVAYFGDTSPDATEKVKHLESVWKRLAPLVQEGRLKGIFLECSYVDRKKEQLFGHLDAKYLMEELTHLASFVNASNPKQALKGLKVLVVHIKDPMIKGKSALAETARELEKLNDLGVEFLFPIQGQRIEL